MSKDNLHVFNCLFCQFTCCFALFIFKTLLQKFDSILYFIIITYVFKLGYIKQGAELAPILSDLFVSWFICAIYAAAENPKHAHSVLSAIHTIYRVRTH